MDRFHFEKKLITDNTIQKQSPGVYFDGTYHLNCSFPEYSEFKNISVLISLEVLSNITNTTSLVSLLSNGNNPANGGIGAEIKYNGGENRTYSSTRDNGVFKSVTLKSGNLTAGRYYIELNINYGTSSSSLFSRLEKDVNSLFMITGNLNIISSSGLILTVGGGLPGKLTELNNNILITSIVITNTVALPYYSNYLSYCNWVDNKYYS